MNTGCLQSLPTELTGAIRPRKRRNDEVAALDGANLFADRLDDADELVPHALPRLAGLHLLVRPQVAPAYAGARDPEECVGGFDQVGVRDSLDANVARTMHNGGSQGSTPVAPDCFFGGTISTKATLKSSQYCPAMSPPIEAISSPQTS